jgi:hypothetical protein
VLILSSPNPRLRKRHLSRDATIRARQAIIGIAGVEAWLKLVLLLVDAMTVVAAQIDGVRIAVVVIAVANVGISAAKNRGLPNLRTPNCPMRGITE